MQDNTEVIIGTFQEIALFHRNVGLLLETADDLFSRRRWNKALGSVCIWTGTSSLKEADRWMPMSFFRAYKNEQNERNATAIAFASVLIDLPPPDADQASGVVLLTAGGLFLPSAVNWSSLTSQSTEIFRWHLLRPDRDDSGQLKWQQRPLWPTGAPKKLGPVAPSITDAVSIARPLIDVVDAKKVEEMINPLVNEIENRKPSAVSESLSAARIESHLMPVSE